MLWKLIRPSLWFLCHPISIPMATIGVHKVKYHPNEFVDKYKAHLMAKRYTQQVDLDFIETFFPCGQVVYTSGVAFNYCHQ